MVGDELIDHIEVMGEHAVHATSGIPTFMETPGFRWRGW